MDHRGNGGTRRRTQGRVSLVRAKKIPHTNFSVLLCRRPLAAMNGASAPAGDMKAAVEQLTRMVEVLPACPARQTPCD